MERNTNVTSGTAVPSEGPSERDRNPRKGGRFAKKKEKSKNKEKNKSKNAKKNESTPGADDGTPAAVLNSREYPEGDLRGAIALPGGASEPRTDTEARRDSGIEDDPSRSTGSTPGVERNRRRAEVRAQRRDSPDPEEPSSTIPRSKSRSRSGSRKRFSSLFRRRGRSNRSKSETDISKVERRDGARRHESADDVKGRRSEEENQVNRLRQSASLDRDAYRRYHPAKQPRDRLMHMTVKDVIIEDRRRRDVSLSTLASLRRDTALQRPGLSSSVPDVSNAPASASPTTVGIASTALDGDVFEDAVDERLLVKAGATLPRHGRPGAGAMPSLSRVHPEQSGSAGTPDASSTQCGNTAQADPGEGSVRHVFTDAEATKERKSVVNSSSPPNCDKPNSTFQSSGGRRRSRNFDNSGLVIFINPKDIIKAAAPVEVPVSDTEQALNWTENGSPSSQQDDQHQRRMNTLSQFLELSKTMPAFSNSSIARERRIGHPGDTGVKSPDLSPAPKSSRDSSPINIPSLGARDQTENFSASEGSSPSCPLSSPEIAVSLLPCKEPIPQDMLSSFASSKRSSDQGFFSEPKSSDTESEEETSGFSTPPEEPEGTPKVKPSALSPATLVAEVKNRLEVPGTSGVHKSATSLTVARNHKSSPPAPTSASKHEPSGDSREASLAPSPAVSRSVTRTVEPERTEKDSRRPKSADRCGKATPRESGQTAMSADRQQKAVSERSEQKTMPAMGTSVQQKYRRTFQRCKNKEPVKENKLEIPHEGPQERTCLSRSPSPISIIVQEAETNSIVEEPQPDGPLEDLVKRGRDSQRRRGYVSIRSFRKKKEAEIKEDTKAEVKEDTKVEVKEEKTVEKKNTKKKVKEVTKVEVKEESNLKKKEEYKPPQHTQKQQKEAENSEEELRHRLAFLDKSTQTSETLLYELLKTTKAKRKGGLFSSTAKRSKNAQEPEMHLPPPPQYEEERKAAQTHDEEDKFVDARSRPPTPTKEIQATPGEGEDGRPAPCNDGDEHNSKTENEVHKATKPRRLPLRSIVLLKQKLGKNRKKRRQSKPNCNNQEEETEKQEDSLASDTLFTIENEINLSKLAEIKETDILDDEIIEPDFGPALPKKQLRFEPIASDEPIQGEEPLPPLPTSRRLATRRNSTRARERRKKCLHCCKKFIAFLFSHIGLCSLVVGYTILGGFVFQALEAPNEKKIKNDITLERVKVVNRIESLATGFHMNELGRENLTEAIQRELIAYQKFIHTETKDRGWDGKEIDNSKQDGDEDSQWSFASALLYAITVMTTIGESVQTIASACTHLHTH